MLACSAALVYVVAYQIGCETSIDSPAPDDGQHPRSHRRQPLPPLRCTPGNCGGALDQCEIIAIGDHPQRWYTWLGLDFGCFSRPSRLRAAVHHALRRPCFSVAMLVGACDPMLFPNVQSFMFSGSAEQSPPGGRTRRGGVAAGGARA